ncbi:hypothetical protein BOTBODRAFT_153952 [Botryobasidium botryosum FD-172 SS1]|uniref:Transcription initiation factor TFIID subunit 10 n=1 Tax=Botryobasidium botryosum (strain FD-172 SS1) TaxID=930990 RepID=A0A067N5J0_BOTB1|nr:hypothetical protein BOTBODRAFT_153952 [Botryobasidium botryosum FD-172 SS1]
MNTPTPASSQQQSQPQPGPSNAAAAPPASQPIPAFQERRNEEQARKDRTLVDFMLMLDDYEPLIPNEVTEYYLQRVGFECEDVRVKRLLSLAAQKFISDIAGDAYQYARIRTNAAPAGRARVEKGAGGASGGQSSGANTVKDKTKTVLTMDDLGSALAEYGINARKPEFFL